MLLSFLAGCGLPDTLSLDKPEIVSVTSNKVLAFITPDDTTNILGYTVYYKVYFSQTDFDNEQDESVWFDEGTYINSDDEMQPGPVIPNQRGYIRVGNYAPGSTSAPSYESYQIENPGNSTTMYINFDSGGAGVFDENSPMPIVHLGYPVITTVLNTLVRGVNDDTDTNLAFRSFVKNPLNPGSAAGDWDYVNSDTDGFYDGDLRRKRNLTSTNDVTSMTSYLMSGEPFAGLPTPSDLIIGIVVHSFGLDPVNLQPLYSKPVYVGTVGYSPLTDTSRSGRP